LAGYLHNKVIAVTGAGRGIGRAIALGCANEGARVVVNDYGVSVDGREPTSDVADAVVKEIHNAGGTAISLADSVTTMVGGERIARAGIDEWGHLDGVVCVAGILRERMIFNMSEDEWDSVIETHLKGTFTVFRAATQIMRQQRSGTLIGFTSGAFAGSTAQANYSAAKGGIVSLVRSAAAGMHKYGVTANCIAPTARTRMSANVPMEIAEIGEPEDVAPMVVYLLSDQARHITGQIYSVAGNKIGLYNQPTETRTMYKEGDRWTPTEVEARMAWLGQNRMAIIDRLDEMARAAKEGDRPNA
jgi:NAD(P)-dependent dehydrogenase (short-subunit alcohol dehydrogenase family)